jgi:hypothetical protein
MTHYLKSRRCREVRKKADFLQDVANISLMPAQQEAEGERGESGQNGHVVHASRRGWPGRP